LKDLTIKTSKSRVENVLFKASGILHPSTKKKLPVYTANGRKGHYSVSKSLLLVKKEVETSTSVPVNPS